jgi:hypothetical protein
MFSYTGNPPCAVYLCRLPITLGVTGITFGVSGNTLGVLKMGRCPRHFNPVDVPRGNIHLPTDQTPGQAAVLREPPVLRVERLFPINGGRAPTLSRHSSLLMQHSSNRASRPRPSPPKDRDTEKETAFPVAKHRRFRLKDCIFYRGAASYGLMRPLAGLESMDINNARCDFGRHHRP